MFSANSRTDAVAPLKSIWALLPLGWLLLFIGCGATSQQSQNGDPAPLAGNWQFSMGAPSDGSFVGGLQGAFLLRNNDAVTGAGVYALRVPGDALFCNSGSASITGKITGQNVALVAVAGSQTFTLTGALSADGSTMTGTYASSSDSSTQPDGKHCGTAQKGLSWSAHSVPPLNGDVQGFFHSQPGDQLFPITGILTQGDNIGASSAMITGTLTFQSYSCLGSSSHQIVNVTGQISGTSVILQIIADSGLNIGQIGRPLIPADLSGAQSSTPGSLSPVKFESLASGGNVLHGLAGYGVTTKACPKPIDTAAPGELGNVCLALGNAKDCTQPLSLSPARLGFPAQLVGSSPVSQTITLTNTDPAGSTLKGLSLSLSSSINSFTVSPTSSSDFNGLPSFTEADTCAVSPGSTFDLAPQQSCVITISFSPQQSCTWLPIAGPATAGSVSPALCPPNLKATVATPPALGAQLRVKSPLIAGAPESLDSDTSFVVPISGIGLSAVVPSVPELDFGPEALSEASSPQVLSFTNQGTYPVQVLPAAITPCTAGQLITLQQPVQPGQVSGLLVVTGANLDTATAPAGQNTVKYTCDIDLTSGLPNFQISSDACTGKLLAVGESCTLNITYVPQPQTDTSTGLDYFLQLNTLQCANGLIQPNCEIDSGRFPVELKANPKSPLRMFPAAGLNFGAQSKGISSTPLTIRLSNDANDPLSATVQLKGNATAGDYTETDDCGGTLAPGGSCTVSVVFTPQTTGFDPGTLTITYLIPGSNALPGSRTQTVSLRGTGQ